MAIITPENARELSAKGNKIRWEKWKADKIAEKTKLERPTFTPPATIQEAGLPQDEFRNEMLSCTRKQMKSIQGKIDKLLDQPALDTKALRDLTDAIFKLEGVEQKYSGRPAPGSLRPKQERSKRETSAPEPSPE